MGIPETSVSMWGLTVEARDTIDLMVENADNPWGCRLHDALVHATGSAEMFAVAPYASITEADFAPGASSDASTVWEIDSRSVDHALDSLKKAGLVETRTVMDESPCGSYLSDRRIVTAVHVVRPFAVVSVVYSWSSRARLMRHIADQWEIADRSYIVPAGWYLVGEVGEIVSRLVGVAGVAGVSEDTFYWLYDLEGFSADQCCAECDGCGSRWSASSGSWKFEPDCSDACTWTFDDVDSVEDNTVACPQCMTGRVGFMVA